MKKQISVSSTFLAGLILTIVMGGALFIISQESERQRHDIKSLSAAIQAEEEKIMLLEAEWAFVNRPERIAALIEELQGQDVKISKAPIVMHSIPVTEATVMPPMNKPAPGYNIVAVLGGRY